MPKGFPLFKRCEWLVVNQDVAKQTSPVLFSKSVKYLGHVVFAGGVTTDPEKIVAVRDWPTPHNKKQLRNFLGFCSYYQIC